MEDFIDNDQNSRKESVDESIVRASPAAGKTPCHLSIQFLLKLVQGNGKSSLENFSIKCPNCEQTIGMHNPSTASSSSSSPAPSEQKWHSTRPISTGGGTTSSLPFASIPFSQSKKAADASLKSSLKRKADAGEASDRANQSLGSTKKVKSKDSIDLSQKSQKDDITSDAGMFTTNAVWFTDDHSTKSFPCVGTDSPSLDAAMFGGVNQSLFHTLKLPVDPVELFGTLGRMCM